MQVAALMISITALLLSATAMRQIQLSRHSNSIPVLVDLFREHRSDYLAKAHNLVVYQLSGIDLASGLAGLPDGQRQTGA